MPIQVHNLVDTHLEPLFQHMQVFHVAVQCRLLVQVCNSVALVQLERLRVAHPVRYFNVSAEK